MRVKPGTIGQTAQAPLPAERPSSTPAPSIGQPAHEQLLPPLLQRGSPTSASKSGASPMPLQLRLAGGEAVRPKAPWAAHSEALAAQALDAARARGLHGDEARAAALGVLLESAEVRGQRVSLHVERLGGKGAVIVGHQDTLALNPASNSKLATATFALGVLGPEHRFKTEVLKNDAGNVYLRGGFDPSLTTQSLVEIARALRASGVREISGQLIIDNSRLAGDRVPRHFEEFGDEDWEYLARPEALSVDRNLVELHVAPGRRPGDAARIETPMRCFEVRSSVVTKAPGQEFRVGCDEQDRAGTLVRNARGQAIIDVKGDIAADYVKGKVLVMKSPDVAASVADRLAAAFESAGIKVRGRVSEGTTPTQASLLHEHRSAPLRDLIRTSISTSNAFDHEMYCLAASAALSADGRTSLGDATARMERFLADKVGLAGFRLDNASGLGDANRLSGGDMVALLRHAAGDARFSPLLDGLARPGATGTLKTRMLDTPAKGRLRAKTGTLRDAVALSGVVEDRGERRLFSVLVNGQDGKALPRTAARTFVDAVGIVVAADA